MANADALSPELRWALVNDRLRLEAGAATDEQELR
jgi:hypothetical protein